MFKIKFFEKYFSTLSAKIVGVDPELLLRSVSLILETHERGGKVIFVGNGGSAAMASHLSVDLTKAARVRAINFNEADLLTCFSNDYGYENWVKEALKAYADSNDAVVLISSSGKSSNIINGAIEARHMKLPIITLSGIDDANPLRALGDINFWCDSRSYNIVEMSHHVWLLAIVDYIVESKK
jgi:D-sedoheptulose 7-phosphate isomerase